MEIIIWIIVVVVVFIMIPGLRVVDQYERGVVLTLGKYTSTRNPGLTWIFPGIQIMTKVDLRITTTDIPQQEVITKDNVPVGINAVVYFQVESADKAILNIKDYTLAVSQYAQAALRDVIGGIELDSLLSEREKTAQEIKKSGEVAQAYAVYQKLLVDNQALDFGDLARGTSAVRRVDLQNGTFMPMYVFMIKTGSISSLIKIDKNNFRLNPHEQTKIEYTVYMPASAEVDSTYDGRVYLFKVPTFGL